MKEKIRCTPNDVLFDVKNLHVLTLGTKHNDKDESDQYNQQSLR